MAFVLTEKEAWHSLHRKIHVIPKTDLKIYCVTTDKFLRFLKLTAGLPELGLRSYQMLLTVLCLACYFLYFFLEAWTAESHHNNNNNKN